MVTEPEMSMQSCNPIKEKTVGMKGSEQVERAIWQKHTSEIEREDSAASNVTGSPALPVPTCAYEQGETRAEFLSCT